MTFHIDIVMHDSSGRAVAVIDTKYKPPGYPEAADIHQMVSYATMMGAKQAFLVYPSHGPEPFHMSVKGIQIRSLVFDVGTNPEEAGLEFLRELMSAVVDGETSQWKG